MNFACAGQAAVRAQQFREDRFLNVRAVELLWDDNVTYIHLVKCS